MIRGFVATLAVAALVLTAGAASAAGWSRTRDVAMGFRERGQAAQAYALAAAFRSSDPSESFDSSFVAGFLALRSLGRADAAAAHFTRMAQLSGSVRPIEREAARSASGYWLGRALTALGRGNEAVTMYKAAAAYPHSFYGQLAAAEAKVAIGRDAIATRAGAYPQRALVWHDQRARRELVLAVIREESRFRTDAVSTVGAKGMMQVMDGTARLVGKDAGVAVDVRLMRSNPDYNIAVGSRYLADQLAKYRGNAMLAAAAYNAGPGRVDEWLGRFGDPRGGAVDPVDWVETIPFTETRNYVKKVIGSYVTYIALAAK